MAVESNVDMFSGDDRRLRVSVKDLDNASAPLDLTGLTVARWELSKKAGSAAKITKTLGAGVSVFGANADGVIDILLAPADTADLAGDFYHELEIVVSGRTCTVMYGTFTIRKDQVQ